MIYEAEFASGLLSIVRDEIRDCIGNDGHIITSHRDDSLQFTFNGNIERLLRLRTVISIYAVVQFDIPRPKALLGHQHLNHLLETMHSLLDLSQYQSLYLNAAGSDSSVMMRIKTELSQALNLAIADEEGDLLLRIRRTPKARQGWDVLIRLTARPLATRDWRVCNYEGALNASVAAAIIKLTNPTPQDRFLNIVCGSGTMMIERQQMMPAQLVLGCDISQKVLDCATQNMTTVDIETVKLIHTDAIHLPFVSGSIDKLVADLPFGQLVGSHDENEWLYPAILHEAARVAKEKALFVVITHEIHLMESILAVSDNWQIRGNVLRITLSGLHPRIYVLERQ